MRQKGMYTVYVNGQPVSLPEAGDTNSAFWFAASS